MSSAAVDKLQKLTINAFANPLRDEFIDSFEALFNPKSLQRQAQVNYSPLQGINTSGLTQQYSYTAPQQLSFKLLLDGTGFMFATLAAKGATVASEVERFQTLTLTYNGELHQPNFLTVNWAELDFSCRLSKLAINYTLFDEQGQPLSAELDCTFIADEPKSTLLKQENKQSPDLTQIRYIDAANNLMTIANEIYQSPDYYLALAQYNGINHFRAIAYGQKIICPPLEKLHSNTDKQQSGVFS